MEDASPSALPQTLPNSARVRKRRDFLAIQATGRREPTRHFLVLVAEDASPEARLGITVTRRIGNSVARNAVKRRVREAFRRVRGTLRRGLSIVVVARDGSPRLDGGATAAELAPVFARFADQAGAGSGPVTRSSSTPGHGGAER